jgi:hypothetical protein
MGKADIFSVLRSKNTVFTFKDIALLWRNPNTDLVKRQIHYYVKTGRLYPIRRGIYATDPDYNRFELATKIYTPSYVSLETVLQKEGVIFQHYSKIFVVTYLTREIRCDGQTYAFKKSKGYCFDEHHGNREERKLFNRLKRARLSGCAVSI